MDKKTAHYFATLAARETFNKTFKKLAQTVQPGEGGRVEYHENEYSGGTDYDPSKNTGGETTYKRIDDREVNRPGGELGGWMPSNSGSFEVGKADDKDKEDKDEKCPKCGCACKSKKESSAKSSLMKVAEMYAKALK